MAAGPTFLLTDIEGSTWLWERDPGVMSAALSRHDELLTHAVEAQGGRVVKQRGEGDSIFAVFDEPAAAVRAALDGQLMLDREPWETELPLRVRMALHTGPVESRVDDYYGPVVNRCGRLRGAAHGGQVLLSHAITALASGALPEGGSLRSLGRHRLKDLPEPEEIFQLCHERLRPEFPPIRTLESAPHDLPVGRMPRTKVTAPSVSGTELVRRSELFARTLEFRLTTVVAGPGFGKSTALGAWCGSAGAAWYSLDSADASPARLVAGLVEALHVRLPAFAADFGAVAATDALDRDRLEALAATLASRLDEALTEPFGLVLDDLHQLPAASPSLILIEALLRLSPPQLHFVMSSREPMPFPIERLRSQGEVVSVEAGDLAFTATEIASMLAGREPRLAEEIWLATSGWPAAARLAIEALGDVADGGSVSVLRQAAPGGRLYGYLAEEVLGREPDETRALLEQVAPIGSFTVDLCDALGIADAEGTLARLLARGIFLEPGSGVDGWYALHALFREVALARAPSGEARRALLGRAAQWFEARGLAQRAMHAYATAGDDDAVRRLVIEHGHDLVAAGESPLVVEIAARLPEQDTDPEYALALAELLGATGEIDLAQGTIRRAIPAERALPSSLAFRYGMMMHYLPGRLGEALTTWDLSRPAAPQTHDDAMLLAFTANAEAQLGLTDVAQATAEAALAAAARLPSRTPEAEARIAIGIVAAARGEHREAENAYRAGLAAAELSDNLIAVSRARVFLAESLLARGACDEAAQEAEIVLPVTERIGWWLFRAWALCVKGRLAMQAGELEEASTHAREAEAILTRRSTNFAARPLALLGELLALRGEPVRAAATFQHAVTLARRSGLVADVALALEGLARVTASSADGEAERAIKEAMALPGGASRASTLVAAGWIALLRGDPDHARERARVASASATARDERPAALAASELAALAEGSAEQRAGALEVVESGWQSLGAAPAAAIARLIRARLMGTPAEPEAHRAERTLVSLGLNAQGMQRIAGPLAAVPRADEPPVAVETLGGFAVLREGGPISIEDWRKSRKARELLKVLIARRGRPAARDQLMELLWPDEPADKLANRLSVALAAVRNALDPDREFATDHFVRGDATALSLDLSALPVDVERFLALAESGLALALTGAGEDAIEMLELAAERYTGDFLEEDLYADWAEPLRDEARAAYAAVVRALYEAARSAGASDRAVQQLLRLLEREPHDERAHLDLVGALSEMGRHGESRRRYLSYARRMTEIGVEPVSYGEAASRAAPEAV